MTKAAFFDALGTLVELEPPWVGLQRTVGDGVPQERLVAGVRAEMTYYKEHSHEGRDAASLADLRQRCAALLSREIGVEVTPQQLVEAIRFQAYADAVPALAALRRRGLTTVVVSNWDCSLPEVLERCGLSELLDGVVSSASAGARKPDAAIFAPALALAGCAPDEAVHVGDTPEEDGAGAAAAGIRALIVDRAGRGDLRSLVEIEAHL